MILPVNTGENGYDIVMEQGALDRVGELFDLERKVLIVTDMKVPYGYAAQVERQSREPYLVRVPEGEASKSMENFALLLKEMLRADFTRKDCVVAVGGGVVGDLAAFAASCYMRGIDFYNVPTTLLAQVDSSIGGKTAIDFEGVKNIVGSFYQPKKVIIDYNSLHTLNKRQLSAGMAEAIKMAMTSDAELFEKIRTCRNAEKELPEIIEGAVKIKKDVVEKDPKEKGLRRILNFGHTAGHAVEALYEGQFLHGECVALGMLCMCSKEARAALCEVLSKFALPIGMRLDAEKLMPFITHDKKAHDGKISVVYVENIGSCEIRDVTADELREYLKFYA